MDLPHTTPTGAKETSAPSLAPLKLKQEPGLSARQAEAPSQLQQEETLASTSTNKDQLKDPWEDPDADQQLSGQEAFAERDQPPNRQLGQKYTYKPTDLQRFGPEMIQIFKATDEKKRAKTELVAAQLRYSEACKAVDELRESTMAIFDSITKSEHADTDPQ